MHSLGDDKELDRLSQEAAGRYTPPATPDWDALSSELDKVMPVTERKRRVAIYWWLLPVLLAGSAGAYWLSKQNDSIPEQAGITATENKAKPSAAKEQTATDTKPTVHTSQPPALSTTEHTTVIVNKERTKQFNKRINKQIENYTSSSAPGTSAAIKENFKPGVNSSAANSSANNTLVTAETGLQSNAQADVNIAKEATATVTQKQNDQATNTVSENTVAPSQPTQEVAPDEKPLDKKQTPSITKRGKGFSVGILAGIDKSTVKFKYGYDAGINAGIMMGYHFNNRFSLHTGAVYTHKNYKVAGEDFTAPKGSWVSLYKLDNVEGYCRMWEVPLLARFTVSESAKSSTFLSTGLSSYFMTRENYDYTYYNPAGTITSRNSAYGSGDTHIMSILHLSAGFEKRLSNSMSLQVEPYAKIPLTGMGFGNIKLSSFGLNFSVEYRQPAKKQTRTSN